METIVQQPRLYFTIYTEHDTLLACRFDAHDTTTLQFELLVLRAQECS